MVAVNFVSQIPDTDIEAMINKYASSTEIWWGQSIIEYQQQVPNGVHVTPLLRIYLGMRGALLGPEHYIWWTITMNTNPDRAKLEEQIMNAITSMREAKAQQMNGSNPMRKMQ